MSQELVLVRKDDFDGEIADATVAIGLNGVWTQLDLTEAHGKELVEKLRPYLERGVRIDHDAARKLGDRTGPTFSEKRDRKAELAPLRDWWRTAKDAPRPYRSGGIIPADIYDAFNAWATEHDVEMVFPR